MQQAHAPNTRHSPASLPRRLSSVVPFTRPSDRNARVSGDEGSGKNAQFGSPSVSQGRRSSLSERGTAPPLGLSAPPAATTTTGFTLPEVFPVYQQRGFQTAERSAADAPLRRSESSALKGALSRELSREAFSANSNSSALKVRRRAARLTSGSPARRRGQSTVLVTASVSEAVRGHVQLKLCFCGLQERLEKCLDIPSAAPPTDPPARHVENTELLKQMKVCVEALAPPASLRPPRVVHRQQDPILPWIRLLASWMLTLKGHCSRLCCVAAAARPIRLRAPPRLHAVCACDTAPEMLHTIVPCLPESDRESAVLGRRAGH